MINLSSRGFSAKQTELNKSRKISSTLALTGSDVASSDWLGVLTGLPQVRTDSVLIDLIVAVGFRLEG